MWLRVRTQGKLCGLQHALPLAAAQVAAQVAAQAAAQAVARKLQRARRMAFYLCVRAIAFMLIHTACKWNCWKFCYAISGNTEKVEICSTRAVATLGAWGARPPTNRSPPQTFGKLKYDVIFMMIQSKLRNLKIIL